MIFRQTTARKVGPVLLVGALLFALFAPSLVGGAAGQDAPLLPPHGFPTLDAAWQDALTAVVAADEAYLPGPFPYAVTAFSTAPAQPGAQSGTQPSAETAEWALAVIVPAAVIENGWEQLDLDQLVDVLILRTPTGASTFAFSGHVRPHPAFGELAARVPTSLVDYGPQLAAGTLGSRPHSVPPAPWSPQDAGPLPYRFPWTAGQTWWLGSGWHSGYGPDALDFSPLTDADPPTNAAVLAAAGGTLRMACQNDQEQRLLWIDHPNGERTGYLHLDRAAVAAAVEETGLLGQAVPQGAYLGFVYYGEAKRDGQCPAGFPTCRFNTLCGYGSAPHVHFLAPNRTITIDGYPIEQIGDGSSGSRFTSTNVRGGSAPDTLPPTATLTTPGSGSTTLSPTAGRIALAIAATDPAPAPGAPAAPPSGVARVSVQLAWQAPTGDWLTTAWTDAIGAGTPAPAAAPFAAGDVYTATLEVCTQALQLAHNTPVRLTLRAADAAGNHAEIDGGLFRFSAPDLDGDCTVSLRDLLSLEGVLAGARSVPPTRATAYDVDHDGTLTPADAAALTTYLQEGGVLGAGGSAAPFPAPTGLAYAQSVTGGQLIAGGQPITGALPALYAADTRQGALAIVDAANRTAPSATLPISPRLYGLTAAAGSLYLLEPLAAEPSPSGNPSSHLTGGFTGGLASRLYLFSTAAPLTPTLVATLTLGGAAQHAVLAQVTVTAPLTAPATVSDPDLTAPVTVSDPAPTGPLTGSRRDLLYVAAGTEGLHIIDVTTPATPTLLSTLPLTGTVPSAEATGVAILDHPNGLRLALLAAGDGGLQIADVTDPSAPQHLAALPAASPAFGVTAAISVTSGGAQALAYVATGLGGVKVIDVTLPTAPHLLGTYATTSSANTVLLVGDSLYVAAGWQGVVALGIRDPRAPRLLGSYTPGGYAHTLALAAATPAGDLFAIAAGAAGLQFLTVAAPPAHTILIPLAGRSITP